MKNILSIVLVVCLLTVLTGSAASRDRVKEEMRVFRTFVEEIDPLDLDQGIRSLHTAAATDTYCIVWYNFEPMDWQGWTKVDNTAQVDTFFQVEDFVGMGGGGNLPGDLCGSFRGFRRHGGRRLRPPGSFRGGKIALVRNPAGNE